MNIRLRIVLAFFALCQTGQAQGFINLDLESANLAPVPSGQFGGDVPTANAIPGWSAFIGATQVSQVLQNNYTLGNASIDILGPNWNGGGIIEGEYTVVLQPGVDPFGSGQNVSASISQIGQVQMNSQSLEFKAETYTAFSVALGGENLSLFVLGTGPNYTLYGANISAFAGQTETLTVTALAAPNTADYFDSFDFNSSPIPEPRYLGVLASCSLFFIRWWQRKAPKCRA
jgi:hypothetical protein